MKVFSLIGLHGFTTLHEAAKWFELVQVDSPATRADPQGPSHVPLPNLCSVWRSLALSRRAATWRTNAAGFGPLTRVLRPRLAALVTRGGRLRPSNVKEVAS